MLIAWVRRLFREVVEDRESQKLAGEANVVIDRNDVINDLQCCRKDLLVRGDYCDGAVSVKRNLNNCDKGAPVNGNFTDLQQCNEDSPMRGDNCDGTAPVIRSLDHCD